MYKDIGYTIKNILNELSATISLDELENICTRFGITGHLAVLNQPYLNKIINGEKTIESRFRNNKSAPYNAVNKSDILFLKESGGKLLSLCFVEKSMFFGPLQPGESENLMNKYYAELAVNVDFIKEKCNSKYASLMYISGIYNLIPKTIIKKDMRPWVILNNQKSSNEIV